MKFRRDQFVRADEVLATLSSILDVTYTNPVNGRQEKEKFFAYLKKGEEYNPVYKYGSPHENLARGEELLSSMNFDNSPTGRIFADLTEETKRRIRMIASVGKSSFTENATDVYGMPSPALVEKSKYILESIQPGHHIEKRSISSEMLAERFQGELEQFAAHWKIEISTRALAKVNVIPGQEKIEIRGGESFSEAEARRLIAHEINAHLLRAVNGSFQPFRIFSTGLADNERTDEGLATLVEELTATISNDTFRLYAGRVLAVHISQIKSFYGVFRDLCEYFNEEDAFYITQRVKRGLARTESPGGLVKDYIYLDGREKVRLYLEEDGDIRLLYCGNVSVQVTKFIKELLDQKILCEPRYFPKFLNESNKRLLQCVRHFQLIS